MVPTMALVLLFVLLFPAKIVKAEMQEFNAVVNQVLTINIPDDLNFFIHDIDGTWQDIPFQVGISTNNRTGYTFISDAPSKLQNSNYSGYNIVLDDKWKITYPSDAVKETSTHTTYPSSDETALDKKYDFTISVLADSHIVTGSYVGAMNFFATANPVPNTIAYIDYLQQINNDIVLTMTPGKFYQLKDNRDGKKYWIVFQDGELKMAQNLDYNISSTTNLVSAGTNINTSIILSNATITGGTFEESWVESETAPQSYDEGTIYRPSEDDAYTTINSCVRDGYTEWECYRSAVGNYYNWNAAIATNNSSSFSEGIISETDICPTNWQLPLTAEDGYLSATAPADKAAAGKIRCVGIKPEHFVIINVDDYFGHTDQKIKKKSEWGIASFNLPKDIEYEYDNVHELAGWSTKPNSTIPEYIKGGLFETDQSEVELYAVWKDKNYTLDDITTMQEMTPTIVKNTPRGTSKQLIDTRDNKKYWVTKFGDSSGDIWMTQNLDFVMDNNYTTYSRDTTDVIETISYARNASGLEFDGGDYYFANGTTKTSTSGLAEDDVKWHYHIGNYYSWQNAKLGYGGLTTDIYSFESTRYSICPKGWGIPTTKEFERFNSYSGEKYIVRGGYLTSNDIVSNEGYTPRYLLNDWYRSGNYIYMHYFEGDYYSYYSYKYSASYNYRLYASSLRCIARRDIAVNDPTGTRLEERAFTH